MPIQRLHIMSLAVFLIMPLLCMGLIILYDIWVYNSHGSDYTITTSMKLVARDFPLVVFLAGLAIGAFVGGLAVHFWPF